MYNYDPCSSPYPAFDANGNVTDYVDAYGNVCGHFEYDAFGGEWGS